MGLNASVFRLAYGITESSTVPIDPSKMWEAFAESGAPRSWRKFCHLCAAGNQRVIALPSPISPIQHYTKRFSDTIPIN